MVSGFISYYFSIPAWLLMQKYIVSRLGDVERWVKHTWVENKRKYLNFFRNHCSYMQGRKLNKSSVLVTLYAIVLVFQHHHSSRNTLFPDSMMSKDELSTPGWKLGWNIWFFLEITAHIWNVEKWTNYSFLEHFILLFQHYNMIVHAEIHCFLTQWCL